jgi:dTDP-4-dehydrorhamnose reductase
MSAAERRILLIGADGQLGHELQRTLAPLAHITPATRRHADLRDAAALRRLVDAARPHAIVLAAAYTDVDGAEADRATAHAVNAEAPRTLAESCARVGALLVHFSTDYVFDGTASVAYRETDATAPLSVYGESKRAGERAILETGCPALIFRSSWIYGDRGHNFLRTVLRLADRQDELRIVDDQVGAPTWSRMLAEAVAAILARAIADEGFDVADEDRGLYHLTASGAASWHAFAVAILELWPDILRPGTRVLAIRSADFPRPARRPAYSVLDNTRVAERFGIRMPHWREQLRLLLARDAAPTDSPPPPE